MQSFFILDADNEADAQAGLSLGWAHITSSTRIRHAPPF